MKYEKYKNKCSDKSSVWFYFLRSEDTQSGKCNLCEKIIKCIGGSTTGLRVHLKSVHKIDITAVKSSDLSEEPSASTSQGQLQPECPSPTESSSSAGPSKSVLPTCSKKRKITHFFQSSQSTEVTVSRMAALDGIPFAKFCTSDDLRRLFKKAGHDDLPESPAGIKNIVINYSIKQKSQLISEIKLMAKCNKKFSLTFDEWTSTRNRRYININIHTGGESQFSDGSQFKNLGLVRIDSTLPAETCIILLNKKLSEFELSLDDIVAITTDGASVMCKVGRSISAIHQVCLAHGIHLGVTDVLYSKKSQQLGPEAHKQSSDDHGDSLSDDDYESDTERGFAVFGVREATSCLLRPNYNNVIQKVRNVVKIFTKSPTKNDIYLQKYVKQQEGTELALILDCKTRWSSMASMIERFNRLRPCVSKALIDMNSDIKFTQEEIDILVAIQKSLNIIKITVEAICRRDANLLTADTALKFMLRKLGKQNTSLSMLLLEALGRRIRERRLSQETHVLQYLHSPEKYFEISSSRSEEYLAYFAPGPNVDLGFEINNVIKRFHALNSNSRNAIDEDEKANPSLSDSDSMEEQLNKEIERSLTTKKTPQGSEKVSEEEAAADLEKLIRIEMALYENGGNRGRFLSEAYDCLLSVPPTSVESERAFSAASYICNKIRSSLNDTTLDALCFLRSIFQQARS